MFLHREQTFSGGPASLLSKELWVFKLTVSVLNYMKSEIMSYNDIWTLSLARITQFRMLGLPVNSECNGCRITSFPGP